MTFPAATPTLAYEYMSGNSVAFNFTTSTQRLMFVWKQPNRSNNNLSKIAWGSRQNSGTVTSTGVLATLWSCDSAGLPTSQLASGYTAVTGTRVLDLSGSPVALTPGNYYGLMVQNTEQTPATQTFGPLLSVGTPFMTDSGWVMYSTDSGATWPTKYCSNPSITMTYADTSRYGSYGGGAGDGGTNSGNDLYNTATRIAYNGIRFQPSWRRWITSVDVNFFAVYVTLASVPSAVCQIFKGTTLLATSNNTFGWFAGASNSNHYFNFAFTNPVLLEPDGSYYTIAITPTSTGSSSNVLRLGGSANTLLYTTASTNGTASESYIENAHPVASTTASLTAWSPWTNFTPWMRFHCIPGYNRGPM